MLVHVHQNYTKTHEPKLKFSLTFVIGW